MRIFVGTKNKILENYKAMELKNCEDHTYIKIVKDTDFAKEISQSCPQKKDLIIDLTHINCAAQGILDMQDFVISKKKQGIVVVFVSQNLDYELFDEEIFNIAPSYLEAKDVLEMEHIKKDLGY